MSTPEKKDAQFNPPKEALIEHAEMLLKRRLTEAEKKKMSVPYLAELYLAANPIKEAGKSKDVFDFKKRVRLLSALAVSTASTRDNWSKLARGIDPKAARIVRGLAFEECANEFRGWLFGALKKEPLPKEISTPLFALWEMMHGFDLGIRGAAKFKGGDEWPEEFSWEPEIYLSNFSCAKNLWRDLEKSGEEAWSVILGIAMIVIKDFFSRDIERFRKATGLKNFRTGIGFPDGDYFELKIAPGKARTGVR